MTPEEYRMRSIMNRPRAIAIAKQIKESDIKHRRLLTVSKVVLFLIILLMSV